MSQSRSDYRATSPLEGVRLYRRLKGQGAWVVFLVLRCLLRFTLWVLQCVGLCYYIKYFLFCCVTL